MTQNDDDEYFENKRNIEKDEWKDPYDTSPNGKYGDNDFKVEKWDESPQNDKKTGVTWTTYDDEKHDLNLDQQSDRKGKVLKEQIDINLPQEAIVPLLFVSGFMKGYFLGLPITCIQEYFVGMSAGLHKVPGFVPNVLRSGNVVGKQLGLFFGTYLSSKKFLAISRGKTDALNSFGGGFLAGCLSFSRTTKDVKQIVIVGVGSGILSTFISSFGGI